MDGWHPHVVHAEKFSRHTEKKLYRNSVVNFNSRTCKELCFLIGLQLICQQSEIKTT